MAAADPVPIFSELLIDWQLRHGRHDLPWQKSRDAYPVWLAEIMLQQTQVNTVIPYYGRFMADFPTVSALAAAPLEAVLERWAGLGYYARARNLHDCAQQVMRRHAGCFPRACDELVRLPGIGRTTAAAIAVFAFGARAAILDGNVKRVLCRCFGVAEAPGTARGEKTLWALAESLLPAHSIEAYTQGLMDLGATCCVRSSPACDACPLQSLCVARRENRQGELPARRARKVVPERSMGVLLMTDGRGVLLQRRPPAGIWGGLLVFPEGDEAAAQALARCHGWQVRELENLPAYRHGFTHFHLLLRPLLCHLAPVESGGQLPSALVWCDLQDAETAAVPAPVRKILRTLTIQAPDPHCRCGKAPQE